MTNLVDTFPNCSTTNCDVDAPVDAAFEDPSEERAPRSEHCRNDIRAMAFCKISKSFEKATAMICQTNDRTVALSSRSNLTTSRNCSADEKRRPPCTFERRFESFEPTIANV